MFEEEIKAKLQELHATMSYEQMGRRLNISSTIICNILNGHRPIKNPSVDFLLKVFPKATINLNGDGMSVRKADRHGIVADHSNNNFLSAPIDAIQSDIMQSDLDDAVKVRVWQIIQKHK